VAGGELRVVRPGQQGALEVFGGGLDLAGQVGVAGVQGDAAAG
jgi:hypothetical protein